MKKIKFYLKVSCIKYTVQPKNFCRFKIPFQFITSKKLKRLIEVSNECGYNLFIGSTHIVIYKK